MFVPKPEEYHGVHRPQGPNVTPPEFAGLGIATPVIGRPVGSWEPVRDDTLPFETCDPPLALVLDPLVTDPKLDGVADPPDPAPGPDGVRGTAWVDGCELDPGGAV